MEVMQGEYGLVVDGVRADVDIQVYDAVLTRCLL